MSEKKGTLQHVSDTWVKKMVVFWMAYYKYVFFVVFILLCGWAVFLWQWGMYGFSWSDEQKAEYKKTKAYQIKPNTEDLDMVLGRARHRQEEHMLENTLAKDIFMNQTQSQ